MKILKKIDIYIIIIIYNILMPGLFVRIRRIKKEKAKSNFINIIIKYNNHKNKIKYNNHKNIKYKL